MSLNFQQTLVKFYIAFFAIILSSQILAFPENVRKGYASCASCHTSPTGGGLPTSYGMHASEEFLNTWKINADKDKENSEKEPQAESPLRWGGNLRGLGYLSNNGIYKGKGFIPMQIEGEASYQLWEKYIGVFSAGYYDRSVQAQRYYLLANLTENLYIRGGKFFPAYGIMTAEHAIVTRKGIGFNEGRESENIEVGLLGETGEIVVDAILSEASDDNISTNEKGFTLRTAWYAGGRSQLGVSFLSTSSKVWQRTMYGLFAIAGLTQSVYLLSEVDQEFKKATDKDEISTPGNTRLITYDKLGWEFLPGLHALATYESSVNTKGSFNPRLWSYGPGLQWFPISHLELLAQWQRKYNDAYPNQPGSLATLMVHYYF